MTDTPPPSPPSSFWQSPRVLISGAIAVGIISLTVVAGLISPKEREETLPANQQQNQLAPVNAVTALGRLEPWGDVLNLAAPPGVEGARILKLLVREGDRVKAGQVVAVLDNQPSRFADFQVTQSQIALAQSQLVTVRAGSSKAEIRAQEAEVTRIKVELKGENIRNQTEVQRIQAEHQGQVIAARAVLRKTQAEAANAQRDFQRYQQLAQAGAITASELDGYSLAWQTAQESVQAAQAELKRLDLTLKAQLREAQTLTQERNASIRSQLQTAQAILARIREVRPVKIKEAQAQVNLAQTQKQQAKEALKLTELRSPIAAQVLKIHAHGGEAVDSKIGVMELGQTQRMIAVAEVYESDVDRLKIGQRATISSDGGAFAGELPGQVLDIGRQVGRKEVFDSDPAADVDVRVVEVKIVLTAAASKIVDNLTYSKIVAKIQTDKPPAPLPQELQGLIHKQPSPKTQKPTQKQTKERAKKRAKNPTDRPKPTPAPQI